MIKSMGKPKVIVKDRESSTRVVTSWPLPYLSLRFPSKKDIERASVKDLLRRYKRFVNNYVPLIEPKTKIKNKVSILVVGENEEWCNNVGIILMNSRYARELFWPSHDINIVPLPLTNEYSRIRKLYDDPPKKQVLLREGLDIWSSIERSIDKKLSDVDAVILEVYPPQHSVAFSGIGNIIYALSEKLKFERRVPIQRLQTNSISSYFDAHVHHYLFYGLGGVLLEPDPEWVFGSSMDFMFISFDLSAPVPLSRGLVRMIGVVVTLRNSFVKGNAFVLMNTFAINSIDFDISSILPQIVREGDPQNIIVMADGISPKSLVKKTVDTLKTLIEDAKVLYLDIIKNSGLRIGMLKNGRYRQPNVAVYEKLGKNSIFIQFHRLRYHPWKMPRSLLVRVRHNDLFDERVILEVVARIIRGFQVASQTTYEYEYLKVPPLVQRADKISGSQELLIRMGRSIPDGEYPLGLIG